MVRQFLLCWLIGFFASPNATASEPALACSAPMLPTYISVTASSAILDWVPGGGNDSWEVAVLPVGSPPPGSPTHSAALVPFNATGLNSGTVYTYYVRAVCGAEMSAWVKYPATFITDLNNPSACQLQLDIPDPGCLEIGIEVSGAGGVELGDDVVLSEVRVILAHEWNDDIDLSLRNPNGTYVELSHDNGGSGDNYGDPEDATCMSFTALVSDQVANHCGLPDIDEAESPFIGSFLPENSLAFFNDDSDPNGTWTLFVCDDVSSDVGTLEFVELIFETLVCAAPSTVQITDTDSTSISFDWLPGSECATTLIEYGPPGFIPGTNGTAGGGTLIAVGCPPYTLTGLDSDEAYEFYFREDCGAAFSSNSCVIFGMTDCSPPQPTFIENMDATDVCGGTCTATCSLTGSTWQNSQADDMDWLANTGPTPTTNTGPSTDISGTGTYFYMEASGACLEGSRAELYSPCLLIGAAASSSCHFSFWYHMYGTHVNAMMLEISIDGWQTSDTLWQLSGDQGDSWFQVFIELSAYDGLEAQMRFVGFDGNNARADIALDELVFYGTTNAGDASNIYYQDADGDGYGDTDVFVALCASSPPAGFVVEGGDCNDNAPTIFPNQPESPCDGIDRNCNGDDDESILPPPVVFNDTICNGELALLEGIPAYFGSIIWYDSPVGGTAIDTTTGFVPIPPPAISGNTAQSFSYYAEEENFLGCISGVRAEAIVYVRPAPDILIPMDQFSPTCAGDTVDLSQWVVQDLNNTDITLSYHTSRPVNAGNEIDPPLVSPISDTYYYVLATSAEGCTAVDSILVEIAPSPDVLITGQEEICLLNQTLLQVIDQGNGQQPLQYLWSNATAQTSVLVTGYGPVGNQQDYAVTVTAANGCTSSDSITVTTISSFTGIGVGVSDVTSCGGTDGSINVSPVGGIPPYTISWSGTQSGTVSGQNGAYLIDQLTQGAYTVTVTDASSAACPFVLPNLIVDGPLASVSIVSVSPAGCYGDADGCIEIAVSGQNPEILWSTDDTTPLVCGLSAGLYSVTITDGGCTSEINDIEVLQADSLFGKVSVIQDVSCFGGSDGAVYIIMAGGTLPYSYTWSDDSTDPQLLDVPAGEYSVTVTDVNGCTWMGGPFEIMEPAPLSLETTVQLVDCAGAANGRLETDVSGGTPPYNYYWSNGGNASYIEFLEPGNYGLTIIDFNGCTLEDSYEISEPVPLSIAPLEPFNASCFGVADGSMQVFVDGGVEPYAYVWSNGDTGPLADSLDVGFYGITITDAQNCQLSFDSLPITAPPAVLVDFNTQNASCFGIDNGVAMVNVISGTPPLSYSWSNGDTAPIADSLASGLIGLTITDGVGCIDTFSVNVGAIQLLSTTLSDLNPNCFGGSNGSIFLTAMGGNAPYLYSWSTGAVTEDINGLQAGAYNVTITDEDGCYLVSDSIYLENPPQIFIEVEAIDNILCADNANGAIYVSVSGGTGPFQYNWSNEATTEDILNLPPGNYYLTVVDALNCPAAIGPITLTIPDPLEVLVVNLDDQIDCEGNSVDTVYIEVSGGVMPYSFDWSDGSQLPFLADVAPGEYSVTVTDANGCQVEERPIKILEPIIPLQFAQNLDLLVVEDCDYSGGTSQLQILIEGDGPPYQYNWGFGGNGNVQSDTLNAPALNPGYYSLTLTDGNGCVAHADSLLVVDFDNLAISVLPTGIHDVHCYGGADGWINLNVAGGVPPYLYIWTNSLGDTVSVEQDPMGLEAGVYQIELIDFNNCSIQLFGLEVEQPADSLDLEYEVEDNYCYGYTSGTIDITVSGGTSPYSFEWNNGFDEEDPSQLGADYYSVTVTDANDCVLLFDSIFVGQPLDSIEIDTVIVSQINCFGAMNGMIDLELGGGSGLYSYIWSNNKFTQDISNLGPGFYYCIVVDDSGCQMSTDTFQITQPPMIVLNMSATDQNEGEQDGTAMVEVSGGTAPYSYEWTTQDTTAGIESLFSGFYQVLVTDSLGCMMNGVVFVGLIDSIVSTTTYLQDAAYRIYPNPVQTKLHVELLLPDARFINWEVLDVLGRPLKISAEAILTRELNEIISVEELPGGAYFIRITISDVGPIVIPFIKY
ncbi:MAG: hypothetical protein KDC34_06200 [Saprospiraceae bacterium]|nr:hypothetical protein [Saprospiraceae bacterium]